MTPDLLVIGHVAKDLTEDGFEVGGTVTYAALTALRLGLRPAVVTSAAPDLDVASALPGIPFHSVPSPETTTIRNTYADGRRSQTILGVGGPISASDIPSEWRDTPLVLLGCLTGEIDSDLARSFPAALVVASLQGWLRQWDSDGRVSPVGWEGDDVLPHVDAAVVSEDDVGDKGLIEHWKSVARVLVVTQGRRGAECHRDGESHQLPAFPVEEIDPTGAGDVFSAAFIVRYGETRDPVDSVRFANCAASFCVEAQGATGIPTRAQVEDRLSTA